MANKIVVKEVGEEIPIYIYGEFLSGVYGFGCDVTYDPTILRWITSAGEVAGYGILEEDGAANVIKSARLKDNEQGTIVCAVTRYKGGAGGTVGYGTGGSNNRGMLMGLWFKSIDKGTTSFTVSNNTIFDKNGDAIAGYTWTTNEDLEVLRHGERYTN